MVISALDDLRVGVNREDWNIEGMQGRSPHLVMREPTRNGLTQHIRLTFGLMLASSSWLAKLQLSGFPETYSAFFGLEQLALSPPHEMWRKWFPWCSRAAGLAFAVLRTPVGLLPLRACLLSSCSRAGLRKPTALHNLCPASRLRGDKEIQPKAYSQHSLGETSGPTGLEGPFSYYFSLYTHSTQYAEAPLSSAGCTVWD